MGFSLSGFSCWGCMGFSIVAHGLICSTECGIFPNQGLNLCLLHWQMSDSSAFLNPALTSGSSRFTYYWNLAWRILSITFLACEMRATVRYFEHLFGISLLWDWNENWSFPVLLPLLSFPYFLAYWHLLGNTIQPINSDYCPHSRASCRAPSATWKSQHKSVPGIENWELWQ